jgi:hypothetical protein
MFIVESLRVDISKKTGQPSFLHLAIVKITTEVAILYATRITSAFGLGLTVIHTTATHSTASILASL